MFQAKAGIILNTKELRKYVKKRKLKVDYEEIESLRASWEPTAIRRNTRSRPEKFSSVQVCPAARVGAVCVVLISVNFQIPRNGDISIDFAQYWPEYKNWNHGYIGALVATSESGFTTAVGLKARTTDEFEQSLETLVKSSAFDRIETFISDRETAIWSDSFQERILAKYGIKFGFMQKGSKAYNAERAIRSMRTSLASIMEAQDNTNDRFAKMKWYRHVDQVTAHHNSRSAHGTSFKRNEINQQNFHEYLDERMGDGSKDFDATMTFNSGKIDYRDCGPNLRASFKFKPGDSVILTNKSTNPTKMFEKKSKIGSWNREEHKISIAQLRTTRKHNEYVQG